ncbi:helicase-associated domain-containing protein [Corynebacterium singulare]|uniref:Helicase conserved C-terminal domain n=1 Tax=Corynebacterium singulare TaxID=161899 RepID=A0A0B6EZK3_9CORY|nr:helicase-associated domain-containing protein [Corynebacterium singulare]AJI78394.1 Helicase conserved C-terminal domain [Corynebacterium singulare]
MTSPKKRARVTDSYREWLSHLPEEDLRALLSHRRETLAPAPKDFGALASRLTLPMHVVDALAHSNAEQLAVLEDIAQRGGEIGMVDDTNPKVTQQLKERGLVFGDAPQVRIVTGVMGALPTGWSLLNRREFSEEDIAELPDDERRILGTLAKSEGAGYTTNTEPDSNSEDPTKRLLAKGFLERINAHSVRLPRSLARILAGDTTPPIPTTPSGRAGIPEPDSKADDVGAAAGLEVVRTMEQLIEVLGAHPEALLKDSSVGVRSLSQLAKELDVDKEEAAQLINLGHHARLLHRGEPDSLEGHFLAPTTGSHDWLVAELGEKWRILLDAWRDSPWASWDGTRALSEDTHVRRLSHFRAFVLDVYAHSAVALTEEEFWEELRFRSPLFASHTRTLTIEKLRAEAEWIGAVAMGKATRVLNNSSAAADLVPDTVSEFIIQQDLTILVPGPLEPATHRTLTSLADLESPGLASVYRMSESTIRRGMDHGLTAAEMTEFLEKHSPMGVPQALGFAIGDVAKRHGTLRSGPALSYLRSEDPALMELAAASVSELRLLAPTVAVSPLRVGELLEKLRAQGLSPTPEDESGASIAVAPEPYLLPTPRATATTRTPASVDQAVQNLRTSGQTPSTHNEEEADPLALARAAARVHTDIVISYADKSGTIRTVTVKPLSVEGGYIDALGASGKPVRFPVHRISTVRFANDV